MTAAADAAPARSPIQLLESRARTHFPKPSTRFACLGIVVLATIVLYYQFYLAGAVATHILAEYHMSFVYYVNISVVGYIFGAVASFLTGVADRYGRANIVTVGLFVVGLLCLVGIPLAHSKLGFGIVFVADRPRRGHHPGRDAGADPRLQPAAGTGVGDGVLDARPGARQPRREHPGQQHQRQHRVAGPLHRGRASSAWSSPCCRRCSCASSRRALRDQLMVSARDRALIEARAKGIDVEASLRSPFRQMLKPDIVLSAFAISVFLIIYYAAVGFFPVYFQTIFGFSQKDANGLGNWNWAFNALALLIVGFISDKVRVRKPFMVVGAVGAIIFTIMFLQRRDPSAHQLLHVRRDLLSLLAVSPRRRLRAVDGELHRDRRAAQSGAHRDRSRGVGPGHPHRHRDRRSSSSRTSSTP